MADDNGEEEKGRGLGRTLFVLEATGLLNQEADPGSTKLVDARNGFNKLS